MVEGVKELSLDVIDGVFLLDVLNDDGGTNVWESSSDNDSSELRGEESLFAYLVGVELEIELCLKSA